ncbi:hypothetical protein AB0M46_49090 [Dactylosporangium sp. NPDC051485]|uniref:hypothetical protein n=1 Tax=Dactylosporangium sp. NPDC051485 TaxID=3154846 RepID=UPI0034247A99
MPERPDASSAADDAAMQALAGSAAGRITLPSGRTLTSDELTALASAAPPEIRSYLRRVRRVRRRFWFRRWARVFPLFAAIVGMPVAVVGMLVVDPDFLAPYRRWPGQLVAIAVVGMYVCGAVTTVGVAREIRAITAGRRSRQTRKYGPLERPPAE